MKTFDNFDADKVKMKRIEDELLGHHCFKQQLPPAECVAYLKRENQFNPNVISHVLRLISRYVYYCDHLQTESKSLSIQQLKAIIPLLDSPTKVLSNSLAEKCTELMEVTVSDVSQVSTGKITPAGHRTLKQPKPRGSRVSAPSTELVSVNHVLNAVSQRFNDRQTELTVEPMPISIPDREVTGITPETLEFATGLLRRSHEAPDSPSSTSPTPKRNTKPTHTIFDQSPDETPSSPENGIDIKRALHNSRVKQQMTTLDSFGPTGAPPTTRETSHTGIGLKIVSRIKEISQGFNLLVSEQEEEAQTGLEIIKKHAELPDNKIELQNLDLIPKILNYIKSLYVQETNEERIASALHILSKFCDCVRDVDQMMKHGILQQLTRIMRRCSPSLAVAGSILITRMVGISMDTVAPAVSNTEMIKSMQEHINNRNASLSAIQQYISTLTKLGNDPLCLAEIHKSGLVDTFFEIVAVESAPTSVMASASIQQFAQQNHSIRNHARNNRHLEDKMLNTIKNATPEKRESVQKLIRYIWGSQKRFRADNRGGPPRKRGRPSSPQVQSRHSITYQTESRRGRVMMNRRH